MKTPGHLVAVGYFGKVAAQCGFVGVVDRKMYSHAEPVTPLIAELRAFEDITAVGYYETADVVDDAGLVRASQCQYEFAATHKNYYQQSRVCARSHAEISRAYWRHSACLSFA